MESSPPTDPAALLSIERRLNSCLSSVRRAALDEAQALDAQSRIALCIHIISLYRAGQLRQAKYTGYGIAGCLSIAAAPIAIFGNTTNNVALVLTFFLCALAFMPSVFTVPTRSYAALEQLLDDTADPQMVLTLLELSHNPPPGSETDYYKHDKEIRDRRLILEHTLTGSDDRRMLPALVDIVSHSDSFARSADQKQLRLKALEWLSGYDSQEPLTNFEKAPFVRVLQDPYRDLELTIGIILASSQLGLTQAVAIVDRLTHELGATQRMLDLGTAARRALPELRRAYASERRAETLLRPSGAPDSAAGDELLRAAWKEKQDDKPDELLRADVGQ